MIVALHYREDDDGWQVTDGFDLVLFIGLFAGADAHLVETLANITIQYEPRQFL